MRGIAALALGAEKLSGKALLQHLQDNGGISALRLCEQKVDMLGHNHVSDDHEAVTTADLFEDLEKQIAPWFGVEQRTTLVTTEGDEVQIAGAVVSSEAIGHIAMLRGKRGETL